MSLGEAESQRVAVQVDCTNGDLHGLVTWRPATTRTTFCTSGYGYGGGLELGGSGTINLDRSVVIGNTAGIDGGGIFTLAPITLTQSLVIGNAPDNCVGC